jgi:hypothetical protein
VARAERAFSISALGDHTLEVPLEIPRVSGKHTLRASANSGRAKPTLSRRWVTLENR